MIVTGVRNTHEQFGAQLKQDFTGEGNFTYWVISLGGLGALGYIERLRPLTNAFMALIIVVMVLKNRGFFDNLMTAVKAGPEQIEAKTEGETANKYPSITSGEEIINKYGTDIEPSQQSTSNRAQQNFMTTLKFLGAFF